MYRLRFVLAAMAFAGLLLLTSLRANAQTVTFLKNGYNAFQVPLGGGPIYVAGSGDLNSGAPYQLTNTFGFDVVAVNDNLTLFTNPSGTIQLFPDSSSLLTQGGPVDIANGSTLAGILRFTATNNGDPFPDFQVKWSVDFHRKSDDSDLGTSEFLIDVSANPRLESVVPEPSSMALFVGALAGIGLGLFRRRK